MQSVPLILRAFKSKGRNRIVTPSPVQDNCTIYIYIYIQYIKFSFFESQWTQLYVISSCFNFKNSWSCFPPPLSKVLDNGIEKRLKPNPNQSLKSANVLGATSATLDVADAACLLTSSKVSVRLSLDLPFLWVGSRLPFLSSAATPGDLLKGWGGKKEKQKTTKIRSRESEEKRHTKTKRAPD